jgi:hypothetical protein
MIQFVYDPKASNFSQDCLSTTIAMKYSSPPRLRNYARGLCLQKFIMSAFAAQLNSISNSYFL